MTNLQIRILAATIYFPFLFLSAYDTQAFSLVMSLCLGFAWHEYLSFRSNPITRDDWTKHGLQILLGTLPTLSVGLGYSAAVGIAILVFSLQGFAILSLMKHGTLKGLHEDLGFQTLGLLYITGLFSLLSIVQKECGPEPIWFIFLVVGAADTGAYFAGKKYGKSPFFQNISPKKTLEGFMGGVVAGLVVAVLFHFIFSYYNFTLPGLFGCLFLGFLVSVVSAFGDLFESMLKRHYGVKDSGKLIPGHGGILDRLDGVIFAAAPVFFFVILRGGFR